MFPKLISIGSFFIPTYGTLVAIGFLAALWITIRLAKRASLPAETRHQSGDLLRARRTCRRQAVHDPVRFPNLLERSAVAVFAEHAAGRRRVPGRFRGRVRDGHPVHAAPAFAAPGDLRCLRARHRARPSHRPHRMFFGGLLLGHSRRIVPWAITFRNPQAAELTGVPLGIPLHPTQLYECVADALIFAVPVFSDRQDAHRGRDSRLVSGALFHRALRH